MDSGTEGESIFGITASTVAFIGDENAGCAPPSPMEWNSSCNSVAVSNKPQPLEERLADEASACVAKLICFRLREELLRRARQSRKRFSRRRMAPVAEVATAKVSIESDGGGVYPDGMSDQDIARFRAQAEDCRQQAERAVNPLDKEAWLRVAGEWIKMAQEVESRSRK